MAILNPTPEDVQPQDDLRYSRGIPDDRSFSTLFGGIADALDGYTKAKDEQTKNQIYEDTLATTDKLQQPYIDALNASGGASTGQDAGAAGASASASSSPTGGTVRAEPGSALDVASTAAAPAALQVQSGKMSQLQAAMNAGTITDSYYHNQLNSMVKSLRANFPGYNQQIDATVQSITGITPANALVSDYFQAATKNATAAATDANKWQTWVNTNQADIVASGLGDLFQNPTKYDSPEGHAMVQHQVAIVQAQQQNLDVQTKALALKKAQGQDIADDTQKNAMNFAGQLASNLLSVTKNTDPSLFQKLAAAQSDPTSMTPDDIMGLQQGAEKAQTLQSQQITDYLYKPYNDSGDTRAADINDQDKINQIYAAASAPIKNITDAIGLKQFGLANYYANWAQVTQDSDKKAMLTKFPVARSIAALNTIAGQASVSEAIGDGPLADPYKDMLRQSMIITASGGAVTSADDNLQTLKTDSGTVDPKVVTTHISDAISKITDPKIDPKIRQNLSEYLYGQANGGFLNNFPLDQQTQVYNQMTNPAVTKQILKASESDPALLQQYTQWSARSFTKLFTQLGQTVQQGIVGQPNIAVGWNPDTAQFTLGVAPGSVAPRPGPGQFPSESVAKSVRQMNIQLADLKPIIEANGGDTSVEVLKLLRSMGVDTNAPKSDFWGAFNQGIIGMKDYIYAKSKNLYGSMSKSGTAPALDVTP